ncbi:hypothetical protein [Weissella cibaria]|uniref:hypothetical protein n=1 Tax=Weissella cibaria TaxID=137591 RepID=UPI00106E9935|nr:hypothetical protein [Weissella cibaria]
MAYSSTTVSRRGLTREVTLSAQATHQSEAVVKQQVPKSTAQVEAAKAAPQATKHAPVSTTQVTVAKRAATTIAKPVTKKWSNPSYLPVIKKTFSTKMVNEQLVTEVMVNIVIYSAME